MAQQALEEARAAQTMAAPRSMLSPVGGGASDGAAARQAALVSLVGRLPRRLLLCPSRLLALLQ